MPTSIPTKEQFKKATDIALAASGKRAADSIINRIDALLDAYHAARGPKGQIVLLGRVFFATDLWLKNCDRGAPETNTRRRPAVYTFYKTVVARLTEETRVPVNLLPDWIVATFGKSMVTHGAEVDLDDRSAEYLTPEQAAKYRLRFANGLAEQQQWWKNSAEYIRANTVQHDALYAKVIARQAKVITDRYAGYVVTMSGDFYVGPHFVGNREKGNGRYHSSYMSGEAVLCGGEILIEEGVVRGINNSSGHYKPGANNLIMAVETLATVGVNIRDLVVSAAGHGELQGDIFLRKFDRFDGEGMFTFANPRANPRANPDWGDTPLSRHGVKAANKQLEWAQAAPERRKKQLATLKAHWQRPEPKKSFGIQEAHGRDRRYKCQQCEDLKSLWPTMDAAIAASSLTDANPV